MQRRIEEGKKKKRVELENFLGKAKPESICLG
jgi:hypothetical protein